RPAGRTQEVSQPHAAGGEGRGKKLHLAVGDVRSTHERVSFYFSLGSSASLTPSPKNTNESMVTAMAIDGNTQRCQYERMYCRPSPTICPHDGMGGLMPTPMSDSAASVKIASGMPNV